MSVAIRRSRASSRALVGGLTRAERLARTRIATAKQHGVGDVRLLRAKFDELRATRSLSEQAEKLIAARVEQGLPPVIGDPEVLDKIASLIDGAIPPTRKEAAREARAVAARG